MKCVKLLGLAFLASIAVTTLNAQSLSGAKTHWDKGTLVVETPARPAGQQHAVGLTLPKMKTVRVAFVGLGMRGPGAVARFTFIPGVDVQKSARRICVPQVWLLLTSTLVQMVTRNSASVMTLTWSTSQLTG